MFETLDKDKSGSISLTEALPLLIMQVKKGNSMANGSSACKGVFAAAIAIFNALDVNKDGKISREVLTRLPTRSTLVLTHYVTH